MIINKSIYESGNGGLYNIKNNDIQTSGGLGVIVYLKLFGGNVDASTVRNNEAGQIYFDWWGNNSQNNSDTWINSETERALRGCDTSFQSLNKIINAIKKDLKPLQEYGDIEVDVTYPEVNRVKIDIEIVQKSSTVEVSLVWDSTKNEVITNNTI
jgi:hypothetical protein